MLNCGNGKIVVVSVYLYGFNYFIQRVLFLREKTEKYLANKRSLVFTIVFLSI